MGPNWGEFSVNEVSEGIWLIIHSAAQFILWRAMVIFLPDMPNYPYTCQACRTRFLKRLSFEDYEKARVSCPKCGSAEVQRRIGRVRMLRSTESRLSALDDPAALAVPAPPRAAALEPLFPVHIQEEGQVRLQPAGGKMHDLGELLQVHPVA